MAYSLPEQSAAPVDIESTDHLNRLAQHRFHCPRCQRGQQCVTRVNLLSLARFYADRAYRTR